MKNRDQTRPPPFRVNPVSVPLVCPFRRAEVAPAPAPDFQPTDRPVSRKTGLPQNTPRDRTAHRSSPPSLPLHSGSQELSRLATTDRQRKSRLTVGTAFPPGAKTFGLARFGAATPKTFAPAQIPEIGGSSLRSGPSQGQRCGANPLTTAAVEVRTTDGVVLVCFFIGRDFNPSFPTGLCLLI